MRHWRAGIFDCFGTYHPCRHAIVLYTLSPCSYPWVVAAIAARVRTYPLSCGAVSFALLFAGCVYATFAIDTILDLHARSSATWWPGYVTWMLAVVSLAASSLAMYLIYALRTRLRQRLGIAGDSGVDAVLSVFCGYCSVLQMANEVDLERGEVSICRFADTPPYIPTPVTPSDDTGEGTS